MKTLKDLTSNILSGNLTESGQSFKEVLAEKVASRLYEKKKGRYDKDLDKNKNGKLDKDDFKILRGEKDHCCSEEVEGLEELDKKTLGSYVKKANADTGKQYTHEVTFKEYGNHLSTHKVNANNDEDAIRTAAKQADKLHGTTISKVAKKGIDTTYEG